MEPPDETSSMAKFSPTLSSDGLNSPTDSNSYDRKIRRLRTGKQVITGYGARLKKNRTASSKSSGVTTPLLKWKFDDGRFSGAGTPINGRRGSWRARSVGMVEFISARKLAAGLWYFRPPAEVSTVGGKNRVLRCKPFNRLGFEHGVGHVKNCKSNSRTKRTESKDSLQGPLSAFGPNIENQPQLESSSLYSKYIMERATKWDHRCSETSEEVYPFYNQMQLLADQHIASISVISALQADRIQAQADIHKLKAERKSCKKKLEHFLNMLDEEMTSQRRKELRRFRAIIDDLKDRLKREKKGRERMEIVNSKLIDELTDAKLSINKYMQDYEKEKKDRELMEEVANELAKEVDEDKDAIKALKKESMEVREEVEQERKMLQMAEVWREERVQLKLVDAKLILEEKYNQMNKLVEELQTYLNSRLSSENLDFTEAREADSILQEVNSVKVHDVKEFTYVPPRSNNIFSIIEDVKSGETDDRAKLDVASHEANEFIENPNEENSTGVQEDVSGWETESRAEDLGSCYSTEGSDSSVEMFKTVPNNEGTGRVSNVENISPPECGRNSNSGNPHIARGMKGWIEWPKGIKKISLKGRLLEARVESQKSQMRHVLKQKS